MTKEINVSEPWFTYIKERKKKIEGRLNKGIFATLTKGDVVKVKNGEQYVMVKILQIVKYDTFEEYLMQEGLKRTLPKVKTINDGCDVYYKFYTREQERDVGVLAIYLKVID